VVDLRYHLASLAAVFVALAVGILLGVAISGKISDASDSASQARIADLSRQLENERTRIHAAVERGAAGDNVVRSAYPVLMENRLAGKHIAVVFIGSVDSSLRPAIEQTLVDSGAGRPVRMIALELPLDGPRFAKFLRGKKDLDSYLGDDDYSDLGRDLGREFALGGQTPLWNALSSELILQRSPGSSATPADGVVVVRSWVPPPKTDERVPASVQATRTLVEGLVDGLQSTNKPVVGVEGSDEPKAASAIPLYQQRGISSVDDLDLMYGKIALGDLLAGGEPGHYGVKDTAQAVTPAITPVQPEQSGNG
jgi:hypothetical protein